MQYSQLSYRHKQATVIILVTLFFCKTGFCGQIIANIALISVRNIQTIDFVQNNRTQ